MTQVTEKVSKIVVFGVSKIFKILENARDRWSRKRAGFSRHRRNIWIYVCSLIQNDILIVKCLTETVYVVANVKNNKKIFEYVGLEEKFLLRKEIANIVLHVYFYVHQFQKGKTYNMKKFLVWLFNWFTVWV